MAKKQKRTPGHGAPGSGGGKERLDPQPGLAVRDSEPASLAEGSADSTATVEPRADVARRATPAPPEETLRRQNAVLAGINRIFHEALTCETQEQLGVVCLKVAEEITDSRFGFLGEVNADGRLDTMAISDPGWAACRTEDKLGSGRLPRQFEVRGIHGRVLRDGRGFFTNDPSTHPDRIGTPPGHPTLEAFLGAPLIQHGQTIGMIGLGNRAGGYRPEDLEDLGALTPAIVEALMRKRAEQSLQRVNERLGVQTAELRAREQALRDGEQRYRDLIEMSNSIIMKADGNLNITYMNPFGLDFFGYTAAELIGRNVVGTTVPARDDQGRDLAAMVQDIVKRPEQYTTNVHQNMRKNGERVWVTWTNSVKRDPDGRVVEILAVGNDIDRRQQAEEALQQAHEELQAQSEEMAVANAELRAQSVQLTESEQRLRLALEGGRMGRWEWDLQADAMFWCARTYELLGGDPYREAGIETLLKSIHPEDRSAVKTLIARVANEAPADFQAEFRVLRQEPRSDIAWLALHAKVIRDNQERTVRMIGLLCDITPRKQMEAELRRLNDRLEQEVQAQTEELRSTIDRLQDEVARRVLAEGKLRWSSRMLEAFFRHTTSPLAFLDPQFNFVRVNEAYAWADGQTPEFFGRRNFFLLYPSEENRALFEQVVRTREPYHARAKLFAFVHHPQQNLRHWNWHLIPLLDDAGRVQFLVFNLEDVSEQQKAFGELEYRAAQLQKLTLELAQAEDRERRRLAEILHDDLQQMLAAAKFHLGLLKTRIKKDESARELADLLSKMLKDAIEKSRSLSHELSPAVLYQSDLGETFEWLARQVQAKHGLTVHTEIRGKIDTPSEAIKAFLFRAAQEMLFNTVKHARVPEARLRVQRRRGQIWLTIGDRGRGFDPRALGKTTGFGLFSLRERVELLGGRMKICSTKGQGSVLLIAVTDGATPEDRGPRTEDGTARTSAIVPSSVLRPPSSGQRLRILLVDDHKTMREGLAALIAEQGDMEVVGQAGDGRKAVELAPALAPDVVIMDVAMPLMPGDEATRQIKALLPQTRIVALSMFEEAGVAQRMRDAGAEAYLAKTGPSEALLTAIRGQ